MLLRVALVVLLWHVKIDNFVRVLQLSILSREKLQVDYFRFGLRVEEAMSRGEDQVGRNQYSASLAHLFGLLVHPQEGTDVTAGPSFHLILFEFVEGNAPDDSFVVAEHQTFLSHLSP